MHLTLVCPRCLSSSDFYRAHLGAGTEWSMARCDGCNYEWRVRLPAT
jgi:hypothetical protein